MWPSNWNKGAYSNLTFSISEMLLFDDSQTADYTITRIAEKKMCFYWAEFNDTHFKETVWVYPSKGNFTFILQNC